MGESSVACGAQSRVPCRYTPALVALTFSITGVLPGAELKPATIKAFEIYIRNSESRIDRQLQGGHSLWVDDDASRLERVRQGEIVVQPWTPAGQTDVPDGLVHDWIGAVFIRRAKLDAVLAAVQDYNHHYLTYKSEVLQSRLLSRRGEEFRVYLRVQKRKVQTVVLNTEHLARYFRLTPTRTYSRSQSTRIAEVDHAGESDERERPEGQDHGYLWRLYSYWQFEERDRGVFVECRAISLTRSVPKALRWLVGPIIRGLPRESLNATLESTRAAVR